MYRHCEPKPIDVGEVASSPGQARGQQLHANPNVFVRIGNPPIRHRLDAPRHHFTAVCDPFPHKALDRKPRVVLAFTLGE
jgi:hypothetical protein